MKKINDYQISTLSFFEMLTLVLAVLKVTKLINVGWFIVFLPIIIPMSILVLLTLLIIICDIFDKIINR